VQTFVIGADGLNVPAPPGNAKAVGACNCMPKITRATKSAENKKRIGVRKFLKFVTP
jgi:hypothetical protein